MHVLWCKHGMSGDVADDGGGKVVLDAGEMAGVAIGFTCLGIVLAALSLCFYKKCCKNQEKEIAITENHVAEVYDNKALQVEKEYM